MAEANITTSNRWDTRTLVTMALLAAIGAALSFIEFPFGIQFLKYDASNIPALVGGFVYGPTPGFVVGLLTCVIHAIFTGDWGGCIMNVCAMAAAMLPAAILYKHRRKLSSAIIGLVIGIVLATAVMIGMNLLIDPIFYGYTTGMILSFIVPIFLPFNLLKSTINAIVTIIVYKPISRIVKPKNRGVVVEEPEDDGTLDDEDDDLR